MDKMYFGMSVDDVGLDGWCKPSRLSRLIEFFCKEDVSATFFVVPVDEATNKPFYTLSSDYLPIIRDALQAGFNFEQHGLRHNRFELGVPPMMVLDLPHEAENKRWAAEHKAFLEKDHCTANCRERLRQGRAVLEDVFGYAITGFRAPALQESPGMFEALKEEGYKFDSSACLQETGWDYILDKMDVPPREITRDKYEALRVKSYGLTLPLTCDYTWCLAKEKYAKTMELAKHDFRQCLANDIPFVTVCHVDPVLEGEGLHFLSDLYKMAKEESAVSGKELEIINLKTLSGKVN